MTDVKRDNSSSLLGIILIYIRQPGWVIGLLKFDLCSVFCNDNLEERLIFFL